MRPLKLVIPGEFWDSQIYAGKLYLFKRSGELVTLDWDRLISEWSLTKRLELAMECGFTRSDLLYGDKFTILFADEEIKNIIQDKFEKLSLQHLEASVSRIDSATVGRQASPFPFPHSDVLIYNGNMYAAARSGVFRSTCNKRSGNPVSSRPEKQFDASVFAMSASYGRLALACGDDGLFEYKLPTHSATEAFDQYGEPRSLVQRNCIDCAWSFYSIYGSSHVESGYLAEFVVDGHLRPEEVDQRRIGRVVEEESIFHGRGYSWGTREKFYQARDGDLFAVRYRRSRESEGHVIDLGPVRLAAWKGPVISGAVGLFGTVVECENAIVVLCSDDEIVTIPGAPINWRVFVRSRHYENQLHVVYEDRLELWSFNHDYFVDQEGKRSGLQVEGLLPDFRPFRNRWRG